MNDLQKLRIVENDIKGCIAQIQFRDNVSNDAICLVLGNVMNSYERARATDYLLAEMTREQEEKKEAENGES